MYFLYEKGVDFVDSLKWLDLNEKREHKKHTHQDDQKNKKSFRGVFIANYILLLG